jgi:iron(III) transport system ATP-binding protein
VTQATRPAAVALEGIAKKFGAFVALRSITLSVAPGEFVCFLGPSGCGKTTLLRIIAGLERQNAGVVMMAGKDVSGLPPKLRNYGIVFQSYALFPNLSVARNIAYGLETRKMPAGRIDGRVDELLDLIGLRAHKRKYPAQLSGGEQQRVALARALAPSPALLLLDEPLSALDARVRQSLRHEIRDLQRRLGITTIMVTHDQEEALAMADRIVVMNHGVVEQVGTPVEVYRRPRSPFVARFVGQMNFIPAVAGGEPGRVRVGDTEVCHVSPDALGAGVRVTLAIRPEEIVVGPAAQRGANRLLTKIQGVQFLGSFTRLSLRLPGAADVVIDCDVAANALAELDAAEGAELLLGLKPEALRVFVAEAAAR